MQIIINWLVSTLAILATAYVLPGVAVGGVIPALIFAVVLAILNVVIRPLLLILTLPINILTLGLFTFVINALVIMLASYIVPGFVVDGFLWALAFGIILTLVMSVLNWLVKE